MRRRKLITLAMLVFSSTGFTASNAGWFSQRWTRADTTRTTPSQATLADALSTEAGMRYRQSRPHHWRQCLLQR